MTGPDQELTPCSCGKPFPEDGGVEGVCECCSRCVTASASRNWCPGSGSHDEYYWQIASDHVRCVHCLRPLMLTRKLTLPKHVWQVVPDVSDSPEAPAQQFPDAIKSASARGSSSEDPR